jgi:hypothetical protein
MPIKWECLKIAYFIGEHYKKSKKNEKKQKKLHLTP